MPLKLLFILITFSCACTCVGQSHRQSTRSMTASFEHLNLTPKLSEALSKQQLTIERGIDRQTAKYFQRLQRTECRLAGKLRRKGIDLVVISDSMVAASLLTPSQATPKLQINSSSYSGRIDSMVTAMRFLERNPTLPGIDPTEYSHITEQYAQLSQQLASANRLKEIVQQRKDRIQQAVSNLPIGRSWRRYQKQVIYYRQQLDEFRRLLDNPNEIEKKALQLLSHLPAYTKFFDKYSVLGSMFRLPGQVDDMDQSTLLNGLQTRDAVMQNITQRMGTSVNAQQAIASGMKEGQDAIGAIKAKLDRTLNGGGPLEMPGFTPNVEKSKTFLKRLEVGSNVQSVRANRFFPITSDVGMSLAYRLNAKSKLGIGGSYKLGWGEDYKHIRITHQGIGFRTFIDWKPTGSSGATSKMLANLWITGGGEINHHVPFDGLGVFKDFTQWQPSALLGLLKRQQAGKSKATISILYDFLALHHLPQSQPVLFRVGYTIK